MANYGNPSGHADMCLKGTWQHGASWGPSRDSLLFTGCLQPTYEIIDQPKLPDEPPKQDRARAPPLNQGSQTEACKGRQPHTRKDRARALPLIQVLSALCPRRPSTSPPRPTSKQESSMCAISQLGVSAHGDECQGRLKGVLRANRKLETYLGVP